MCFSFSDVGAEFVIEFTVHTVTPDTDVTSVIDLSTPVYGKIEITDDSGISQNLDVHLEEVTTDTDNTTGGDEFILIENG